MVFTLHYCDLALQVKNCLPSRPLFRQENSVPGEIPASVAASAKEAPARTYSAMQCAICSEKADIVTPL